MQKKISKIFPQEETLDLSGGAGVIDARMLRPKEWDERSLALVCHPHSLHGGSMQNKIVTTLVSTFRDLGVASVYFNFRGVGSSAGVYDAGEGEASDVHDILRQLRERYEIEHVHLAGFSFGAYVAYRAAQQVSPHSLTLVAPPVNHFDFTTLLPTTLPCIVALGEQDEIVPADEMIAWVERHQSITLLRFPETSHFFHGRLIELKKRLRGAFLEMMGDLDESR